MKLSSNLLFYLSLIVFLGACRTEQQAQSESMGELLSSETKIDNFAQVLPSTKLIFPKDHQAHPKFRQEWWYLTANLTSDTGQSFGIQWTQFRLAANATKPINTGQWATNQIYLAHAAITSKDQHYAAELWSRHHPKLASVTSDPIHIFINNWHWQSQGKSLFPAQLTVKDKAFSYSLNLMSSAPYQLQGQAGYSIKTASGKVASHYYSQPFINISGNVELNGVVHQVTGKGWLDREWSSQFLTEKQQGWDWFALRLNEQQTLMLFQLRSDTKDNHFYAGRLMNADGTGTELQASNIRLQATKYQQVKQKNIPIAWQLSLAEFDIELQITALNAAALMPLSISYWEGPITFTGSHTGTGYMELTGY